MRKPEPTIKTVYDLYEILDYVENEVQGFKNEMWKELCEADYIKNDTSVWIPFEEFADRKYYSETIVEGVEYLMLNLSDVLTDGVVFRICW